MKKIVMILFCAMSCAMHGSEQQPEPRPFWTKKEILYFAGLASASVGTGMSMMGNLSSPHQPERALALFGPMITWMGGTMSGCAMMLEENPRQQPVVNNRAVPDVTQNSARQLIGVDNV